MNDYITVGTHQFKVNIARYIREVRRGAYKGVIVERHGTPVGVFMPLNQKTKSSPVDGA